MSKDYKFLHLLKCAIHLDHYEMLAVSYHLQSTGLASLSRPRCHLHRLGTEGVPKSTPAAPHIAKGNVQIFSTKFDILFLKGLNPVFAVIVASHIRLRAMITVLHRDAEHRGYYKDAMIIARGLMCEATMTNNTGLNSIISWVVDFK